MRTPQLRREQAKGLAYARANWPNMGKGGRRKKVCKCGLPSVPGLVRGVALCQTHFDKLIHGN